MVTNRPGLGLAILRVAIGAFLLAEGVGKWRWFGSSALLQAQLDGWAARLAPGSPGDWYLHHVAMAAVPLFARLVPLGEIGCGLALLAGFRTRAVALVALLMVLNFHVASGALFRYGFLTNGYGLPVLGGLLALAVGGAHLPGSVRA